MWYSAAMVVASRIDTEQPYDSKTDVQIKLLRADSAQQAYDLAMERGKTENISYSNEGGETVTWEFLGLYDLVALGVNDIDDDTEVFNIMTKLEPKSIVRERTELSVFWIEENKHRKARKVLNDK